MILQFYERFSLSWSNLGYFESQKHFTLRECEQIVYHFKASDLEIPNISSVSQNVSLSRKYEQKDFAIFLRCPLTVGPIRTEFMPTCPPTFVTPIGNLKVGK